MRIAPSAILLTALLTSGMPGLLLEDAGLSQAQAEQHEVKRGHWQVERSAIIAASHEIVFDYVVDFKKWTAWTSWGPDRDPEATWEFSGPEKAVGSTMIWNGPELGEGKLVIAEIAEDQSYIVNELYFDGKDNNNPGTFTFSEADGKTTVTWYSEGRLGLIGRLFRKSIEGAIGADFEIGLAQLTVAAESDQALADQAAAEAAAEAAALEAEEAAKAAEAEVGEVVGEIEGAAE